jgi:FemAB-related protein (PEP-CTERM system-associated)
MDSLATLAPAARATERVAVRAFAEADSARWEAFVAESPQASFFHRLGWREIIEDELRHRCHYLVAERGRDLVGVLPLAQVKTRLFGNALVSLPFCVEAGVASADAEACAALVEAAAELARTLGVEHLELRNRTPRHPEWPRQELYVTFRKSIFADEAENLRAIPRKQRAMIRKGIANGLRSEIDASVDRFFALYADNMHRHGTPPLSRRYFARLLKVFGDACQVMTVLDRAGRPVSGVLSFRFRDQVLPYYAGDTALARELAANDFKYWELMRRACAQGVRVFDFGRSKRGTGSFDFKRNWGFEPESLAYECLLLDRDGIPENNPLNPKYRVMIALWKRLPRMAANALGPHIARGLG